MSLNLVNIKEQIQTLLEAANTTTASPVDLSANLTRRIQSIKKLNPDKIPSQITQWPLVTVYTSAKDVFHATISVNQKTGKRKGEVEIKVMGLVYNDNSNHKDTDPADDDIEYLMENIEETLRASYTLNGAVVTSMPERVEFFPGFQEEEKTHVRAGILTLKATAFY